MGSLQSQLNKSKKVKTAENVLGDREAGSGTASLLSMTSGGSSPT